ncbi:MAG: right-handed parallel beta-helix repeat-containing protein [Gaiellaceae bacterium]
MKRLLMCLPFATALTLAGGGMAAAPPHALFGDAAIVAGGNPGKAARIRSDASVAPGFGGVSFPPTSPIAWPDLATLSADFNVTDDGCGGGSPRISLGVDTDNDGVRNGVVHIAIGPSPSFTGCASGWQSTGNLIGNEDAGRYDFSQFGGSTFTTYSNAPTSVENGQVVTAIIVVDGSWNAAATGGDSEQTVLVDNINVNGDVITFDCSFTVAGTTMTLDGDCETDATISVPDGFTLDGAGHTITAVDPEGGHFLGAVVKNGGATAYVTNVTVTASSLADVCDSGDARFRGILFDGAAGSITNTTVVDLNQGQSGCQEGNAIEVRNAPFDTTGTDLAVTISGNTATNYQKNGITANGSVAATIVGNVVTGAGPVDYIAQNGIQVGFGATALVHDNVVSGNDYTPETFVACGLLLFEADGVRMFRNTYFANERDVCMFGRGGGQFKA